MGRIELDEGEGVEAKDRLLAEEDVEGFRSARRVALEDCCSS